MTTDPPTDAWFPTFRRAFGLDLSFPTSWPWWTTRNQRRSVLRLILAATEENVPLSSLIGCWAIDESGQQKSRLYRLARLLLDGVPLTDAVEEVRGVLSDEDILTIRFGAQSGTLAASIRGLLDQPSPASFGRSHPWQNTIIYLCVLIPIAAVIVSYLEIKIIPKFMAILREFDLSTPRSLALSTLVASIFADYWYVFVAAIIALCWMAFSRPGRRWRRAISARLFRPLRDLRMADVLQKLSVASRAGRPMPGALSTLARYHFDPILRSKLLFIRNEMEQGADVWQSMATTGLVSPLELRALETSDRVGNRPWVLEQLALLKKRRTLRRLARWSELFLPCVILAMGAFVLIQALGVFGSLVQIVDSQL